MPAGFRIRLCRRLAPRCTKPKSHCLRAPPFFATAGRGVTEPPSTPQRSSASARATAYVRGPVLSEALEGVGCMLALRSRFEPCRLTSELRSSSNCLCTTSSKRRSCIHVSRLGSKQRVGCVSQRARARARARARFRARDRARGRKRDKERDRERDRERDGGRIRERERYGPKASIDPRGAPPLPDEVNQRVVVAVVEVVLHHLHVRLGEDAREPQLAEQQHHHVHDGLLRRAHLVGGRLRLRLRLGSGDGYGQDEGQGWGWGSG